jgi:hypothetical protein
MLSCDGFGFDFAIFECFFIEDEILDMGVVHNQELHYFTENSALKLLAHPVRLFNPLQITMQEFHDSQGGANQSETFEFHGDFVTVHL